VQNIRTHSSKVDIFSEPYRVFMKISALEMEKARRGKERDSAQQRVREIDTRFEEIEKEKEYLLKGLNGIEAGRCLRRAGEQLGPVAAGQAPKSFKIRY
jgi:hypothetical protein